MASKSKISWAFLSAVVASVGLSCEDRGADLDGPVRKSSAALVEIDDCAGLQAISQSLSGSYRLVADVDCTGFDAGDGDGFYPIGDELGAFTGTFDGNGHTITGLTITRPNWDYVGLFGATNGAVLERVGLEGVQVQGATGVGALVGGATDTVVRESYATGTVSG